MKIKFRMSLMVIAVMTIVITGIVTVLLYRTSYICLDSNMRSVESLADQRAEFWKSREDGYVHTLHMLANVMGDYEAIPKEERRNRYDEMLKLTLEAEYNMISLYTVWKPNAIDGMDERYIGRAGSSPTGQYAISYTRETGEIAARTSGDIENIMTHISGSNAKKDRVSNPSPRTVNGKETLTYLISVPIINDRTGDVAGGVGCVLNIDIMQPVIENTIKSNDIIDMAVLYSENGTILAHFIPERIGKKIFDVDVELGDSIPAVFKAIQNGTTFRDTKYAPTLGENIGFVIKPFQIGNSDYNMAILIGASESYIFSEAREITRITIILAVLALVLSTVIVYISLDNVTKPIIKEQTVTLSGIGAEQTGNMTKTATAINGEKVPQKENNNSLARKAFRFDVA